MKKQTKPSPSLFDYIKADPFFRDYLPHIRSYKYKIRGLNTRGNATGFTDEEKDEIMEAVRKMVGEVGI